MHLFHNGFLMVLCICIFQIWLRKLSLDDEQPITAQVAYFGPLIAGGSYWSHRSSEARWSLGEEKDKYRKKINCIISTFQHTKTHDCMFTNTHALLTGRPGVPGNPLSPFCGVIPITLPGSPCRRQNHSEWFDCTHVLLKWAIGKTNIFYIYI